MTPFFIQTSNNKFNLNNIYSQSDFYLYPYARYAFLELLLKLNIKSIYIPSFICRDMLAPINKLGIKYFFYDVDRELRPLLKDVECSAILSINYFGFSNEISPFLDYKEKYNAIFIEDNAHGFLSKDINGNLLGTRGDFGLLSIRKTIFLPNGAALLVNNEKYKNLNFETKKFKLTFEDEKYNKKLSLKKMFISKYIGIFFVLLRRVMRYMQNGSSIPLPDKQSEKELPLNQFTTPILKTNSLNIDINLEIKRRQSMYQEVEKWAKKFNIKPMFNLYDGIVPFEFAFIDNGNYKQFEKHLFTKGFFILPWPDLPDEIINSCPKFYKNIKVVAFLW